MQITCSLCKQVTLLDCIEWIVKAWKDVKITTIEKCFGVAGFSDSAFMENETCNDDDFEDDDVPLATLVAQFALQMEDIHNLDQEAETEDSSDDWEKTLLDNYRPTETLDAEDGCEQEEENTSTEISFPGSEMTHSDVLLLAIKLKNFASENDSNFLEIANELKAMTERKIVNLKCIQKQTTIDSFFKKK